MPDSHQYGQPQLRLTLDTAPLVPDDAPMTKQPAFVRFIPEMLAVALGAFAMLQPSCSGIELTAGLGGYIQQLCVNAGYVDSVGRLTQDLTPQMLAPFKWQFGETQAVAVVLFVAAIASLLVRTRR